MRSRRSSGRTRHWWMTQRGKRSTVASVAVARKLAGFVWGTMAVVPREVAGQEGVRLGDGAGASQAQLLEETVLQRAPEAFDAALGLGRGGEDHLDAELGEGPPELRRLALAALLSASSSAFAGLYPEDTVAVAVHGQRHAG